jgi:hypothetical protein
MRWCRLLGIKALPWVGWGKWLNAGMRNGKFLIETATETATDTLIVSKQ